MPPFPEVMRALVLRAPRQFAVEDVPVPPPLDPDDVLCQVDTTFICGTDPAHHQRRLSRASGRRRSLSSPAMSGRRTWSKPGRARKSLGWEAGDRVCAISHCGCGYCRNCLRGATTSA